MRAMKFETARIHFLGDVFAAVACRRRLSSLMSPLFMSITWRIFFLIHERCHEISYKRLGIQWNVMTRNSFMRV